MARTIPKGIWVTGTERTQLVIELAPRYVAGESIRDLAVRTGRSYGFIYSILKESGIPLRRHGGRRLIEACPVTADDQDR